MSAGTPMRNKLAPSRVHICPLCRGVGEYGICESCKIDAAEAKRERLRERRRHDPDPLRPVDCECVDERLSAGLRLLSLNRDGEQFALPWLQALTWTGL